LREHPHDRLLFKGTADKDSGSSATFTASDEEPNPSIEADADRAEDD